MHAFLNRSSTRIHDRRQYLLRTPDGGSLTLQTCGSLIDVKLFGSLLGSSGFDFTIDDEGSCSPPQSHRERKTFLVVPGSTLSQDRMPADSIVKVTVLSVDPNPGNFTIQVSCSCVFFLCSRQIKGTKTLTFFSCFSFSFPNGKSDSGSVNRAF